MAGPKPGLRIWVSRVSPFELRRGYEARTAIDFVATRSTGFSVSGTVAASLVNGECRETLGFPLIHFLGGNFSREVVIADRVLVFPTVIENDELQLRFFLHTAPPSFMVLNRVSLSRAKPVQPV